MSDVLKPRSTFVGDTAVDADGDCHFTAQVTDRWNGLAGRPLGGYVLAVGLRALRKVMSFPDLLVASAFFLRPVTPGRVDIHVEAVRVGRRTATGQARLVEDGKEALRTVATFADLSTTEGPTSMFCQPPDLPAPGDALDM